MNKGNLEISITVIFIIVFCLLAIFVHKSAPTTKISFSGIDYKEQEKITSDLLTDQVTRAHITDGPGISLSKEISNFCGPNLDEDCEYISCKYFTSQHPTDWIPCSLKQNNGTYSLEKSL